MSKLNSVIIFLLIVGFLGTSPAMATNRESNRYKKHLKTWTRDDVVYQREDFHASLKWHATWLTDDFLTAWAHEQARIYDLDASEEAEFLSELQTKYAGSDVFFVSFYSYSFKESDLSNSKAVWKMSLETENEKWMPSKIEKVSKPTSYHKRIFNYIDTWSSCYFVSFPKIPNRDQDLHLKINGPTGKGQLQWKAR